MAKVTFRFYEELNDYLPEHQKKVDIETEFIGRKSIKETIEDFGVPPASVDMVLVNGMPVDFQHILQDGDRVSVYPVFERLNIRHVSLIRESPLRRIRFIADVGLKDMAQLMRMLGFDTIFSPTDNTANTIETARQENRIILTKQKHLLESEAVTHALRVCPGTTMEQIKNVLDTLDIKDRIKPFSRCLRCNKGLENRQTKEILHKILPETIHISGKYMLCRSCRKKDRQQNTWHFNVDIIRL